MARSIDVVGAVILDGELVFAAQRGLGRSMAGYWEFPGGKVEADETPEEALARELREELKIDVTVGEFIVTATHEAGTAVIELSTYLCTIIEGVPVLTEHEEFRWLPVSQLSDVEWAPADIPTVELLRERFA